METLHHRPVVGYVLQNIEGGDILQRAIRQWHAIASEADDLLGIEAGPEQSQRLLVVIEHHHPAKRLHFLGESSAASSAIQQQVVWPRRPHALNPFADEAPLARIVP